MSEAELHIMRARFEEGRWHNGLVSKNWRALLV